MSFEDNSPKPKLDKRRFWSRVTAAALLAAGVIVGLMDAYASRAQSQTAGQASSSASASSASAAPVTKSPAFSAANIAKLSKSPALNAAATASAPPNTQPPPAQQNPAQEKAARNPSQLNSQISPAATTTSSNSAPSSSTAKPKPDFKATVKKALPTAAVDWVQAVAMSKRSQIKAQTNSIAARLPKLELDKTLLPVLLPRAGATLKATEASMVSFGSAYSLNLPQKPGLNIILYGHRTLTPADKGGVANLKRSKVTGVAEDIFLSQTEDGWTASFKRYGVVYTVDVSCDDLETAECKDDGFIRKAIADLSEVSLGASALKEAVTAGVKP